MALLQPQTAVEVQSEDTWKEIPFTETEQVAHVPAVADDPVQYPKPVQKEASASSVDLAEAGFGGLSLGARSFPMISLKTDGLFEDTDGFSYGKRLDCRLINSKPKTVIQANPIEDNKKDVIFTYDGVTTTTGRSVHEWEQEKIQSGKLLTRREYTDVLVVMESPESEYHKELRILSVAPQSRERLAGAIHLLAFEMNWTTAQLPVEIKKYVLTCECGAKVLKAQQPFYPWAFAFKSK